MKKVVLLFLIFTFFLINQISLAQVDIAKELKSGKQISLTKILDIGVWEGDEQKTFFRIKDVKTDKSGNIYILDSGNHRIQKFNHVGKYISSIGHKGQGPGEFVRPISLFINGKGNIYVLDKERHRITQFDPKGAYVNSFGISAQNPMDFLVDNFDNVIVLETGEKNILAKFDKNGKTINSFCNLQKFNKMPEQRRSARTGLEQRFFISQQKHFYSNGALAINRDIIYLTFKFPYKILAFSEGGILLSEYTKKVSYPVKPPSSTPEEKGSLGIGRIVSVRLNFGTSFGVDVCVRQNMIFNLVASPKSSSGDESKKIDIFDLNSGEFISQIKLPHFTKKIFIDKKLNLFCVVEGVSQNTLVADEIPPQVVKYSISLINP